MKLELTREEILEKLIHSYEGYFDIERSDDFEPPLQAVCHFNVRSAKYVLLKKAELWSATSNEHVYIFSVLELTEEIYRACEKRAYDEGMKLIDSKPGHMYTYIKMQALQKFSFFAARLDGFPYSPYPAGSIGFSDQPQW